MRSERIDSLSLSFSASGAIALTDRKSSSHLVSGARSVQSFLGNYRIDRSARRCVALAFGSATYRLKRLNATKTRRVHATPLWGRSSRSRATAVSCWFVLDSLSLSLSLSLVLSISLRSPSLSVTDSLSLFLSSRLSLLTCLH